MRTGIARLPLHGGKAPRWLFERMRKLASEIIQVIVSEDGPHGFFQKLSNPYWLQAFGCALGFDWHSSGLTTTTCGAIKEGVRGLEKDLGIFVGGGKGEVSRRTPDEIREYCEKLAKDPASLIYASKMSAKVDNTAVQDGYTLYHHTFFFNPEGEWAVVQQGMNEINRFARRYHWWSESLEDFVEEPHAAICSQKLGLPVVNFVAEKSRPSRRAITELSRETPSRIMNEWKALVRLDLPGRHEIRPEVDIDCNRFYRVLESTYERQAPNFEMLLSTPGLGAKTLRALSLVAELIYGEKPSFQDPARFSFAHGGKDGIPYPVAPQTYDETIQILRQQINRAHLEQSEKRNAFRQLTFF